MELGARPQIAQRKERLITGRDLMDNFRLSPGPLIGAVLDRVDEARGAGEIATREEGLRLAAQILEDLRREG